MYTGFYGLAERPFELMPDPRYLYLSEQHREALAHLTYGVSERKDLIQLTGEVGTGKTMLLDALICDLDASTKVAKLCYTTIDALDLHKMVAREFGIASATTSKSEMLAFLSARLEQWRREGRSAVLVVDEAQNLSPSVLEEIRLLSNLRTGGHLSLQIILAGQPELREKLDAPELRQLRQRIGIRYHLGPLSDMETGEYIDHRLAVAGAAERIFGPGTAALIYEYSGGVPRLINTLCDRALVAGYAENRAQIEPDLVRRAIAGLEGADGAAGAAPPELVARPMDDGASRGCKWVIPAIAALAVVIVAAGGYLASHGRPPEAVVTGAVSRQAAADTVEASVSVDSTAASGIQVAAEDLDRREDTQRDTPRIAAETGVKDEWVPTPYAVAAFSSPRENEAWREVERLRDENLRATVVPADLGSRGTWYRVIVDGQYETPADASGLLLTLGRMGYADAWVIRR